MQVEYSDEVLTVTIGSENAWSRVSFDSEPPRFTEWQYTEKFPEDADIGEPSEYMDYIEGSDEYKEQCQENAFFDAVGVYAYHGVSEKDF